MRLLAPSKLCLFLGLFMMASCKAEPSIELTGIKAGLRAPTGLLIEPEEKFSRAYQETECVNFVLTKGGASAGILCSSKSSEFLSDFGIAGLAAGSTDDQGGLPVVTTGMAAYPMSVIVEKPVKVYSAKVDCDGAGGAIYRATSTCYVTTSFLDDGRFLYSNFVIEDHVTRTSKIKPVNVEEFWQGLLLERFSPTSRLRYSSEAAAHGFELAYLSIQLAVNPCIDEKIDWADSSEVIAQIAEARNAWPKGTCEDQSTAQLLSELLYTRHAALAATDAPLEVASKVIENEKLLKLCKDTACIREVSSSGIREFKHLFDVSSVYGEKIRPDFVLDARPIDSKNALYGEILRILDEADNWCGGSSIEIGERKLKPSESNIFVASCFTGAPEYPLWIIKENKGKLKLLLVLEQGSNLHLLPRVSGGLPDLRNSIRVNAGERIVEIYSSNGGSYESVLELDVQNSGDVSLAF
ncbi:hypothetical protein [Pseudoxanthomonas putridarboris]|uniref:Lipoprotein n=1 Tax=Pseudoxanthomonas putridarboris TaxID=752605 RepID=A0ABU9J4K7_9GAMM